MSGFHDYSLEQEQCDYNRRSRSRVSKSHSIGDYPDLNNSRSALSHQAEKVYDRKSDVGDSLQRCFVKEGSKKADKNEFQEIEIEKYDSNKSVRRRLTENGENCKAHESKNATSSPEPTVSFVGKIKTFLSNATQSVRRSVSNILRPDPYGNFGKPLSDINSNSSSINAEEYDESLIDSGINGRGERKKGDPSLPQEEICYKSLVSNWLENTYKENWQNEPEFQKVCPPKKSTTVSKNSNFNVFEVDMKNYTRRRKYGDLTIYVGRSIYNVDSCFIQAQSKKIRHILFEKSLVVEEEWDGTKKEFTEIRSITLTDMSCAEFEALLVYMYTAGQIARTVAEFDSEGNITGPSSKFLRLLQLYGIPLVHT